VQATVAKWRPARSTFPVMQGELATAKANLPLPTPVSLHSRGELSVRPRSQLHRCVQPYQQSQAVTVRHNSYQQGPKSPPLGLRGLLDRPTLPLRHNHRS